MRFIHESFVGVNSPTESELVKNTFEGIGRRLSVPISKQGQLHKNSYIDTRDGKEQYLYVWYVTQGFPH